VKILIFFVILAAAGIVLARSFVKKANSTTDQAQKIFATIQTQENAETSSQPNTMAEEETSDRAEPALWGAELDSLASLNEAAAEMDAVFILLGAESQQDIQPIAEQIEAAAKKIQSNGIRISAFRLNRGAPNYANLTKQLSAPCVLAMVKGGGLSGVSADQISETKLVRAFVAASRPSSGCCPSGGPCGPTK
jgi:hypothetical protein